MRNLGAIWMDQNLYLACYIVLVRPCIRMGQAYGVNDEKIRDATDGVFMYADIHSGGE